ncbi:MAG TPA: hypothetical protein VMG99_09070 [Thermoplasmata archaeon]|nr:hypothetical protein [Thermoplasmata archaeon]
MAPLRLGKKAPRRDPRTLRLGKYLLPTLPPPPASATLYTNVGTWPMDGNDQYGDCTMAGAAHLIQMWTAQTLGPDAADVLSANEVTADYFQLTGGPDSGLDLLTVLDWWEKTGFAIEAGNDRITAYAAIEPTSDTELQDAISLFGGVYLGLALPDFAVNPPDGNLLDVPWAVPATGLAANPPDPQNGHCVVLVGYDARNYYAVTWGAVKPMSPAFAAAYIDEAYAVLSPDWFARGESPEGFDLAQLQQDLAAITGSAPSAAARPTGP